MRFCPRDSDGRELNDTYSWAIPWSKIDCIDFSYCKFTLHLVYDSVVTLAFAFVTFTPSCFAFATISTLFFDETACEILVVVSITFLASSEDREAYSAAKVVLCMRRRSTSPGLLTTKALCPEGIMWRVFLFEP